MRALLRKELHRSSLPRALVAFAFAFGLTVTYAVEPRSVLLPSHGDVALLYLTFALIAILVGLLAGFLQHGSERRSGTEAYLVHRATGKLQPFLAKGITGVAALVLVATLPPLVYGLWHVALAPSVENPLTERLGHLVVVGMCSLPAYGIGAVAAQLRKRWGTRALLALLGGLTLLFVIAVASQPPAGAERTPIVPFLLLLVVLAVAALTVAYRLFRAGEDVGRPWPGRLGVVAALAALALYWLPWTFAVATVQQVARTALFDAYPLVVEDAEDRLYLATELDSGERPGVRAFVLRDAEGRSVEGERTIDYSDFSFDRDPFGAVFEALSTPLDWDHPWDDVELGRARGSAGPFGFDGRWIPLGLGPGFEHNAWLRAAEGTVHAVVRRQRSGGAFVRRVLEKPGASGRFSTPTVVVHPLSEGRDAPLASIGLLVDLADRTVWFVRPDAEAPRLERIPELPGGDRLLGLERLQPLLRARVGLFDPLGASDMLLIVGEGGRHVWTTSGLKPFTTREQLVSDYGLYVLPESEAAQVTAWRLEPSRIDGLGFRLEVFAAQTGELALAYDFRPETSKQRTWGALAWLASLMRPPAGSLWSYFAAPFEPRDVSRMTTHDSFRDPLLLGGANRLLLVTSLALGLLLAWSTHRRLGRDPRERGVRWTWTLAVFALGLPAWMLCRILEPSRNTVSHTLPRFSGKPVPHAASG